VKWNLLYCQQDFHANVFVLSKLFAMQLNHISMCCLNTNMNRWGYVSVFSSEESYPTDHRLSLRRVEGVSQLTNNNRNNDNDCNKRYILR
jgi:hypothetical protein